MLDVCGPDDDEDETARQIVRQLRHELVESGQFALQTAFSPTRGVCALVAPLFRQF